MSPIKTPPPRPLPQPSSPRLRLAWQAAGWVSLGGGVAGIVLPLVPTTPLVLLAAYCFARGSERWHAYLLTHRRFGPLIRGWQAHGVIPPLAKWNAALLLGIGFGLTIGLGGFPLWARGLLTLLGLAILAYILSRPSRPPLADTNGAAGAESADILEER